MLPVNGQWESYLLSHIQGESVYKARKYKLGQRSFLLSSWNSSYHLYIQDILFFFFFSIFPYRIVELLPKLRMWNISVKKFITATLPLRFSENWIYFIAISRHRTQKLLSRKFPLRLMQRRCYCQKNNKFFNDNNFYKTFLKV